MSQIRVKVGTPVLGWRSTPSGATVTWSEYNRSVFQDSFINKPRLFPLIIAGQNR